MDTRALLAERIAHDGLCPGSRTVEEWLASSWIRFRVGRRSVPVIPLWGLKRAHVAHDVHHAVLDYATDLRGECEIAAWELASGGCRWNVLFWIDRLAVFALGLVFYSAPTWRAWRRGRGKRNLYGCGVDAILAMELPELRRRMGS